MWNDDRADCGRYKSFIEVNGGEGFMKTRRFVLFATLLLVSAISGLFAKPNPKAASYKTHEAVAGDKSAPLVYLSATSARNLW